jgi:hypothetical protein
MTGPRRGIPLLLASALVLAALVLAACGEESKTEIAEGEHVELGELEYNVIFSRFLNPNDVQDTAYLEGLPRPDPGSLYLGLFIQVENHDENEAHALPESLTIVDSSEREYEALEVDSPYALDLGTEIPPGGELPVANSPAEVGDIGGLMAVFEIPDSATEERPLRLIIEGTDGPAEIELDL